MNVEQEIREHSLSIIGKELKLIGEFHMKSEVHVYGELEGTLNFTGPGKLVVEQTGSIKGSIFCDNIEIYGVVEGKIEAQGTLIVRSSGKLNGQFKANNLSVYPGALLNIEGQTKA
ncbi:MAG: bactofilin family protein [Bacteriovoracaceae bacterium]